MATKNEIKKELSEKAILIYAVDNNKDPALTKSLMGEISKTNPDVTTEFGNQLAKDGKLTGDTLDKIKNSVSKVNITDFDLSLDTDELINKISNAGRKRGKNTPSPSAPANDKSKVNSMRYANTIEASKYVDSNDKTPQPGD